MSKNDVRVTKTKNVLKKNLMELVTNLPLEKITISRLCESSLINRRTFYIHYHTLDDLVKEIQRDLVDEFLEAAEGLNLFEHTEQVIRLFFEISNRYGDFGRWMGNREESQNVTQRIAEGIMKNSMEEHEDSLYLEKWQQEYLYEAIVQTIIATYNRWSRTREPDMDEVISFTAHMIERGFDQYRKDF